MTGDLERKIRRYLALTLVAAIGAGVCAVAVIVINVGRLVGWWG